MDKQIYVDITDEPIDTHKLIACVSDEAFGGTVLFLGTVRSPNHGKEVLHLEYTSYRSMAIKELHRVAEALMHKGEIQRLAVVHRLGLMKPGETSVAIAVSAPHKTGVFEACREAIDTIKRDVPIWKKEVYEGSAEWMNCPPGAHTN